MLGRLWRRLRLLLARDRATRELEEEMRLHRELRAERLREHGWPDADAQREATRRFGHIVRTTEASRDAWGWSGADTLWQDVRYAARRLRQRPGFTASVVGILALGIGATTAMFSAVDAALLRPLPFPRADELVTLPRVQIPANLRMSHAAAPPRESGASAGPPSRPRSLEIDRVGEMRDVFTHVAAYASGGLNLADPARPRRVRVGVVSGDFFATLGVPPERGRVIASADGLRGAPDVAVLSWGLWQGAFGGRDIVGTTIPLGTRRFEVIGVMPRGFSFPEESDLWIPLTIPIGSDTFEAFRGYLPSVVIARRRGDVSPEVANARVRQAWEQAATSFPAGQRARIDEILDAIRTRGAATPLRSQLVGDRRTALLVLLAITALLLLIACGNVTNLLLSYGTSRGREIAVRSVLGATRGRLLRQLLAESVMLSVGGAVIGVALAPTVLGALRTLMPAKLVGVAPVHLDLRVLAFASALAIVTGVLFGLWPACGITRESAFAAIKSGGGHGASARGARRSQRWLVAGEIALAVVLLVGAGLMLRSFQRLVETDVGLRTERVATLEMSLAWDRDQQRRIARVDALLSAVRQIPGIVAAGVVNDLPLRGGAGGISISVKVDGAPPASRETFPRYLVASGGYFDALGIALRSGRLFRDTDGPGAPPVAVINEAMAGEFWPGVDPVGRTFLFGGDGPPVEVVGVVANVREQRLEDDPQPQMYFPARQNLDANLALVARGSGPARAMLSALTQAVRRVDPAQPVYNVRMMDEVIGASIASRRANTVMVGLFGVLALVIAALGVYAVTANAVAQRSRELGIRAALGATRADLLRHVGGDMTLVVACGIALGASLAWAASRVMAGLVYGVAVHDGVTFAVAPAVLAIAAVVATLLPARRAMRVQPVEVMRSE